MLEMLALLQIFIFLHIDIEMYDRNVALGIVSQKILAMRQYYKKMSLSFV